MARGGVGEEEKFWERGEILEILGWGGKIRKAVLVFGRGGWLGDFWFVVDLPRLGRFLDAVSRLG